LGRFERLLFLTALSGSRYLKPPALPEVADLESPHVVSYGWIWFTKSIFNVDMDYTVDYGGSVPHAGRDKAVSGSAFAKSYGTTRRIPVFGVRGADKFE